MYYKYLFINKQLHRPWAKGKVYFLILIFIPEEVKSALGHMLVIRNQVS